MRDGSTEGMQCFDDEIEKLIRANTIDMDTGLGFATNPGNLRLQLADLLEQDSGIPSVSKEMAAAAKEKPAEPPVGSDPELEVETHR